MAEQTVDDLLMEDEEDLADVDPAMEVAPGDDIPVAEFDGLTVVQAILACKTESEEAREPRDALNRVNWDAAHSRQAFEGKVQGQSAEFLPKTSMALEQFGAFVRKGFDSGEGYFSVELTPDPSLTGGPLTNAGVVKLLRHRLETPEQLPPGALDFPTSVSDGAKVAALDAYMVFKVCGASVPTRRLVAQPQYETRDVPDPMTGVPTSVQVKTGDELMMEEGQVWRLLAELVRPADYYPDPTGRGLYEVHKVRTDLYKVIEAAEAGYYDPDAVAQLVESYEPDDEDELANETDQRLATRPDFRKEVEILEFHGTLLDSDGHVAHRNCYAAVANEQYLICKPEDNRYWHQESPFVQIPLLRVPFSTFHKALLDDAVRINLSMNELYNLIVDGGIGAVWGNRQVWLDAIENADDFSNGIPQGATYIVGQDVPPGTPVVMNTPSGIVPPEAMQTYALMDKEFTGASMMSSTALSQTPRKDVSATATASADQSTGVFLDNVVRMLEVGVSKVLRLCWLTMLQNADDWNADDTAGCIGPEAAKALADMSPAERFVRYGQGCRFRVSGLSAMLARTREFQKLMSVGQIAAQSPIMGQTFMQEFSPKKMWYSFLRAANLDPEDLKITEEEAAALQERMQQLPLFGGGGPGNGPNQMQADPTQMPGNPVQQQQAAISQMNQPPQGL